MLSETYFFYDESSDNNIKLKSFLQLLEAAIQLEKRNNPEVFENSNKFHFTIKSNEIMDQLIMDFSESVSDFTKWAYAIFLVGEESYIDSISYQRKGRSEYLAEISSAYHSINSDNKIIANMLLSKRPWIIENRVKCVLDKIGFIYN